MRARRHSNSPFRGGGAVTPVVGTMILVGITVMLTGVLVYYLASVPSGGNKIEPPVGARLDKTLMGDWLLTIVTGRTSIVDVTIEVINPSTGAQTLSSPILSSNAYFYYNKFKPNGTFLEPGDNFLLNQTAGIIVSGFRVELTKNENTLTGPLELP